MATRPPTPAQARYRMRFTVHQIPDPAPKQFFHLNRIMLGKALAFVAVFSLLLNSIGAAQAKTDKVSVCHKTGNGFQLLEDIADNALPGHLGHGDIYPVPANGCPETLPESTATVTIVKYIDGVPATAELAHSAEFPMTATWNATNIGPGSGNYTLGPTGYNNNNPYQATTSAMTTGASYTTSELTNTAVVGTNCEGNNAFALSGYSLGNTLSDAESALVSVDAPALTNLSSDKYIIVWNKDCSKVVPPVNVDFEINKVWEDAQGAPIDAPNNKDDISITVSHDSDSLNCKYTDGNFGCDGDGVLSGLSTDTFNITETGVPAGWSADPQTVGENIAANCPADVEDGDTCTITIVNKLSSISPCNTELIINGGFEAPLVTDSNNWQLFPSGTENLGWSADAAGTTTNGNLEIQAGVFGWNAHSGNQFAEVDSDKSMSYSQDLITVPGGIYTVTLWSSPRPGQSASENKTEVKAGATVLDIISEDGTSLSQTNWTEHTYTFTAATPITHFSLTDVGPSNGLGGLFDDVSVKQQCVSQVTLCKKDNHDNPLSGWELYLKGPKIETVNVPSTNGLDVSTSTLPAGDYALEASGTYVYRPNDPSASISDAAFSKRLPSDSVYSIGTSQPWVRVNDFPSPYQGYLGIQVDDTNNFDWGSTFSATHNYTGNKTLAVDGQIKFRILDDNYSDNSGDLSVDIYPIIKGTTGDNGCVTLPNIQFDTYTVGEVMQDGWSNVSGNGVTAVINESTENYTVVNRCDSNCKSTVTVCKKDSSGNPLAGWDVFLKGSLLETVSVNSNNVAGADSTNSLVAGQKYAVDVSGTWQNRGFETVDASYTSPDGWTTVLAAPQGGFPDNLLEMQIDHNFIDWGAYANDHKYHTVITGTGAPVNFGVFDINDDTYTPDPSWYGDNIGNLTIKIYPIYEGVTTAQNGCATLENVPFGNYALGEVMQDGWVNESGDGTSVHVVKPIEPGPNTEINPFTLVNSCQSESCRTVPQLHLVKVVCSSFGDIKGNANADTYDATGGKYNLFSNYPNFDGVVEPISPAEIPENCNTQSGWNFKLSTDIEQNDNSQTVTTGNSGEYVTPISGNDSGLNPVLQTAIANGSLYVSEVTQDGYDFGALRCYNDALNGDNKELINLGESQPANIYCIAYNVSQVKPCVVEPITNVLSSTDTQFLGLKEGGSAPADLSDPTDYPSGTAGPAQTAGPTGYPGAWDGSANDSSVSGAVYISNDSTQPTNSGGLGYDGSVDSWRLFSQTFTIPAGAVSISTPSLHFAADNEVTVFLDDAQIGTSNSFSSITTVGPITLTAGTHTLKFAVKNYAFDQTNNPTGVIYKLDNISYQCSNGGGDSDKHTISGIVYNDNNTQNGTYNDGEAGLPGWTVYIDANDNGTLDSGEETTTSGADGHYSFTNLPSDCYVIREVVNDGWNQTGPVGPPANKYQFGIGSGNCDESLTIVGKVLGSVIHTANALTINPDPTDANFGNIITTNNTGGSSGSSRTNIPQGRVLGDTTNIPYIDPGTNGQVLGASTTLPVTGNTMNILWALLALTAVIVLPAKIVLKMKKENS